MAHYRTYFTEAIRRYYADRADKIIAKTDLHFAEVYKDVAFSKTSGNPMDKRLDFSAYFLGLIITLDHAGESFDRIREICLEITINYVQPKNAIHAWYKRMVPKLIATGVGRLLIKSLHKKISVNKSKDGFIANIITDKAKTFGLGYGVDIIECGICKLFKKHNYGKYASILCEVDEITSGLAGLELIRSGTIANGAKICDFRYRVVN